MSAAADALVSSWYLASGEDTSIFGDSAFLMWKERTFISTFMSLDGVEHSLNRGRCGVTARTWSDSDAMGSISAATAQLWALSGDSNAHTYCRYRATLVV